MSEREVRYCTSEDGVRIAYCAEGTGPTLLLGPVMVESFSRHHLVPAYGEFIEALKTNFRLIRFDMRGTGLSQREATDYSTEALIGEVDAVLASERVDRTAILGFAGFGLRAIAYSARRPENVDRLVLGWTAGRFTDVAPRSVWASLITLMEADWRLGARAVADLGTRNFVASSAHLEDMYAESTDARHAAIWKTD